MNWPKHGSNPQFLYKALNQEYPSNFIDFSTNINPLGMPEEIRNELIIGIDKLEHYPDSTGIELKNEIAKKENISTEEVLLGNGAAEIITIIGRWLQGEQVLICQPTFSEYEASCLQNQCLVKYISLDELETPSNVFRRFHSVRVIFLCNPNNPTGETLEKDVILNLLREAKKTSTYVIIDEAFYDFLEDEHTYSIYLHQYSNLIILRSLTKMYAIAGLRLGYALMERNLQEKLSVFLPHWNVNSLALRTGRIALTLDEFKEETKKHILKEKKRLFHYFDQNGYQYSLSRVNYYLLRDPSMGEQTELLNYLTKQGIVPRHTFNFPGLNGRWLRFAIKTESENNRLMEVLQTWKDRK
jgi:threonine-phosphate decarboxylase